MDGVLKGRNDDQSGETLRSPPTNRSMTAGIRKRCPIRGNGGAAGSGAQRDFACFSPDIRSRSRSTLIAAEHGVYCCTAHHAYLDLSPGIDFETRLFYKADAELLRAELRARVSVRTDHAQGQYHPSARRHACA
jgi:hypothetical protein